jgi:hypothetical protein
MVVVWVLSMMLMATAVAVGVGVFVGDGVAVGVAVLVGDGVSVAVGTAVCVTTAATGLLAGTIAGSVDRQPTTRKRPIRRETAVLDPIFIAIICCLMTDKIS